MRLLVLQQDLGKWTAEKICQEVHAFTPSAQKPFVLGLPTGGTVEGMYANLCQLYQTGQLDFSTIVTFNMDEYVGISPQDPHSYHYYMQHHLFDGVNLPPGKRHILNGQASDLQAECNAYEQAISAAGGIHLFLGGVGRNGHIAFNEPGSSFSSRTRPVKLEENTRLANARFFDGDVSRVPTHALSVGIGTVLAAREILFLASGQAKAHAVARLALGEVTPLWPITALKMHPRATLLLDTQAALELPPAMQQDIHQQLMQNAGQPAQIIL